MGCFCGSATKKYGGLERRVYVAEGKGLGEESYHFKTKMCYVSYKKATDEQKMEDGNPLPAKQEFKGIEWDEAKKTFKGTVEWSSPYDGYDKQVYTITFADDFSAIKEGTVVCSLKGEEGKTLKFGEDLKYTKAPKKEAGVNDSFSSYGTVEEEKKDDAAAGGEGETKEEGKEEEKKEE